MGVLNSQNSSATADDSFCNYSRKKAHQKIKDRDLNIGDLPVEPGLGAHWYIKSD